LPCFRVLWRPFFPRFKFQLFGMALLSLLICPDHVSV
jgi:hypothetical protein